MRVRSKADPGRIKEFYERGLRVLGLTWNGRNALAVGAGAITRAPLLASHSNASAVWPHVRNLDSEQLQAVASSGGVVGVNFYPDFIGSHPVTLDHLLDHVVHLVDAIGATSVVLGPDFIDYAMGELRLEIEAHGAIYEDRSIDYPAGAETVRSMQNVTLGLIGRELDAGVIGQIAYGNFARVFEQTQALANTARRLEFGSPYC